MMNSKTSILEQRYIASFSGVKANGSSNRIPYKKSSTYKLEKRKKKVNGFFKQEEDCN